VSIAHCSKISTSNGKIFVLYFNYGKGRIVGSFEIWAALFALATIGVLIVYFFSRQLQKTEAFHRDLLKRQQELEEKQNAFLAKISENIYDIVEDTYKEVASQGEECLPQEVKEKEKELLNVTGDLLEYLRLKSKKVEIVHEKVNINNVLNEVAGRLGNRFEGIGAELIFDIDNTIPRYLLADARNLEKVLYNMTEYALHRNPDGKVKLEIAMFKNFEERVELQFKLSDDAETPDKSTLDTLFVPYYDEEKKSYFGLGLYVAKALIELMDGTLSVIPGKKEGLTFLFSIPFDMVDPNERRHYRLPNKALTTKKVFICDSDMDAALAMKKMFAYFRHEVTVMEKEKFLKKKVPFAHYDIVMLHPDILRYKKIEGAVRHYKKEKPEGKVVAIDTIFARKSHRLPEGLTDRALIKPVTQERVYELIIALYDAPKKDKTHTSYEEEALTHRGEFLSKRGVTQASFADFAGKRLLIVEDDVINQKVLSNILKDSGMEITIAANGMQAVNVIKERDKRFDLVLMDINMPIMDGYTATMMIREDPEFSALPIVAFTALALEDEREKIFASGMNAFLTKPLDIGKLYNVFAFYFKTQRKDDAAEAVSTTSKRDTHLVCDHVIDMRKGLRYANGNEGLYHELLKEFLDAYGRSDEVFETLVSERRYEQLKLLLVDMKGLCATIGATDMFNLVNEIHQKLLYRHERQLEKMIDEYRETLRTLKSVLQKYLRKKKER
jgi:CheY-like chemotaxis protein/signal transduction histidine kinase